MKKILFICDQLENFKIMTDTTYSLMLSANELGYEVYYSLPNQIYTDNDNVYTTSRQLSFYASSEIEPDITKQWYKEYNPQTLHINTFFATFVRNDPPFDMEYYYLTQILSLAENKNIKIVNNSFSLRNFNEKLSILNFPSLTTPTMVAKNKEAIYSFLSTHNECVIKPLDLMAGRGVFKLSLDNVNCGAIIETVTNYFTQTIMLQKFIPEVITGDKRIFIINGKVIEYCLCRIPQNNQIRSNIAAGGRGEVQKITSEEFKLANIVATWLNDQGIIFAGLDVIGNKLTEINITSPTGTRQIFAKTGIHIPKLIIQSLMEN